MAINFLKLAIIYLFIGVCFGFYMSIAENYTLTGVHVHVNLLGWGVFGIVGLLYHAFPSLATTKLAKAHFWLHNIGLPIMMIGLAFYLTMHSKFFFTFIPIGATMVVISILLLACNIFTLKNKNA
ncbi:MAG: cytochrome-c oxidase [Bacillaceae bacterium]